MADSQVKSEFHGYGRGVGFKAAARAAGFQAKPPQVAVPVGEKPVPKQAVPANEDKLTTLRSYRRARVLCDLCAEKRFRGHKCATTINLQAMQEVWDLFQVEAFPELPDEEQESPLGNRQNSSSWLCPLMHTVGPMADKQFSSKVHSGGCLSQFSSTRAALHLFWLRLSLHSCLSYNAHQ